MIVGDWGLILESHGWWHLRWRWRNRRNALGVTTLLVDETAAHFGCRVCAWTGDLPHEPSPSPLGSGS